MHANDLRASLQTVRRRRRYQRPRPQLRPLLPNVRFFSSDHFPPLAPFSSRFSSSSSPPFSFFHLNLRFVSSFSAIDKKNRFDNAVDLTCGTTHLTIGNGGADDLTLGYIDQVLGEDSELDYYTVEYCKKGAS